MIEAGIYMNGVTFAITKDFIYKKDKHGKTESRKMRRASQNRVKYLLGSEYGSVERWGEMCDIWERVK